MSKGILESVLQEDFIANGSNLDTVSILNEKMKLVPNTARCFYDDWFRFILHVEFEDWQIELMNLDSPVSIQVGELALGSFVMRFANANEQGMVAGFAPEITPLKIELNEDTYSSITASVVNGPEVFYGDTLCVKDIDGWNFTYTQSPDVKEFFRKRSRTLHGNCCTGRILFEREDGVALNFTDGLEFLLRIRNIFSFCKGGYVGVGHAVLNKEGVDKSGIVGFTKFDGFAGARNWWDLKVQNDFDEFFRCMWLALGKGNLSKSLLRALDFYRSANFTNDMSRELALVSSYTALEVLVYHILTEKGGWSASLIERSAFHEKLRAVMHYCRLDEDVLEFVPDFASFCRLHNKIDAFEGLSKIRNNIVHPKKEQAFSGVQLYDAWNLSQWICEVLIFNLVGYSGNMNDRRPRSGWRGQQIKRVPI